MLTLMRLLVQEMLRLAKTKAITHLLTYATTFSGWHLMSLNAKAWKVKRALLHSLFQALGQ